MAVKIVRGKKKDRVINDPLSVKGEGFKAVVKENGKILTREDIRKEILGDAQDE